MTFPRISHHKRIILVMFVFIVLLIFTQLYKQFYLGRGVNIEEGICKKCNIIIISLDSLRPDHMGVYGYERNTTPNIDEFVKDGIVFTNAFSAAYLTPISETALHTGRYPLGSGAINAQAYLKEGVQTLGEILKSKGYRTGAFGTSPEYIRNQAIASNFKKGFDVYNIEIKRWPLQWDLINKWIHKDDKKPFFLWLAIGSIHWPYGENKPLHFTNPNYMGPLKDLLLDRPLLSHIYKDLLYPYNDEKTLQWNLGEEGDQIKTLQNKFKKLKKLTDEDRSYIVDRYDDGIYATDEQLRELFSQLKNFGLDKNTVVIIESEHGEDFGEHEYVAHYDIFDTTVHTPLLLKSPSLSKHGSTDAIISNVDVLPTLLNILNIPSPKVDGVSFLSYLTDKSKILPRDEVFVIRTPLWERYVRTPLSQSFYEEFRQEDNKNHSFDTAIRTNEWKLIHRRSREIEKKYSWYTRLTGESVDRNEFELYNLVIDLNEKKDVYTDYPEVAERLKGRLVDWEESMLRDFGSIRLHPGEIEPYF